MARGTFFGTVHSHRDLHLVQAKVDIEPAKPKTNFIDIPGADGSKDFSESPAGRVVFKTRKITWTFKLYPGDKWATKYTQVSNAINGKQCRIKMDDDALFCYVGRVSVDKFASDSILHTITVTAICQPYKLYASETKSAVVTLTASEYTDLKVMSGRMPTIPTITVTAATTIQWNGNTYSLAAGTHKILDVLFTEGSNVIRAKLTNSSSTGTIQCTYQEGAL